MLTEEFQSNLINLQESLMRYANSLTTDTDDAKDLVQETTLKALRCSDQYLIETNFKAWTYTIMKNTFINNYRKSKLMTTFCEQYRESSFINIHSSCSTDPGEVYSEMELADNVRQLKEIFRIPLQMHIYGYKYKEIADALNINIGTVKSRIFLSRKQLKIQLG